MKCPICRLDLSPLDLVSRHEHVELCLENGPSVVEVNQTGQLVVKKNLPPAKQRKICPICDKTFQNLLSHFKTCALKYDVPPSLMLEHWDTIQTDIKNPKSFPRDLLDKFIAKCTREGRLGEQVDFARALSLSMGNEAYSTDEHAYIDTSELDTQPHNADNSSTASSTCSTEANGLGSNQRVEGQNIVGVSGLNARHNARVGTSRVNAPKKTYRLEAVDEATRKANVALRIDRELAITRSRRFESNLVRPTLILFDRLDLKKLFFMSRMKDCNGSQDCLEAKCIDHELELTMEEFIPYSALNKEK